VRSSILVARSRKFEIDQTVLWCMQIILQDDLEKLKLKIFELKQKPPGQRKPSRTGFCGLYGPVKDPIEYHIEKLEDVHRQVRQCQMEFRQKKKVSSPSDRKNNPLAVHNVDK